MDFSLLNFYLEPGNELDFAYAYNQKLVRKIEAKYFKGVFFEKRNDYTLAINISPSKRLKKVIILGPSVDRVNKYINYTVRISYKAVVSSSSPKKYYSDKVEEALVDILEKDFKIVQRK